MHFGKVWLFHSVLLILLLSVQSDDKFKLAFLESINAYRYLHDSPPLILDKNISKLAQEEAFRLCQRKDARVIPFEETHLFSNLTCHALKPLKCISEWYNEGANYNYNRHSPSHFTLMIWKSSKYIGIGYCSDLQDIIHVVVKIYPPGNGIGQFRENIKPLFNQCTILTPNCFVAVLSLIIIYISVKACILNL
ncbi:Golgi-associated plant pathogenesis-related protein 1 [Drosophila mojavensis]|uniref:SCP domain-containing protein n=1 Tax=Drosophila mojavensis TaxID=7230 RepID=A0A0Q9X169_DROMO|nr:Golgi-associated plant pathogenesis-related protein 1 [Drosophila mojavensis]KRG01840.1 uncharacterized protein Dmoj_GI25585 [Drosophila mojavensis]